MGLFTIEHVISFKHPHVDSKLDLIIQKLNKMSKEMDDLEAKVAAQETVEASAITLLQSIAAELKDALANNDTGRITALSNKIATDTQSLVDAITANTPAATTEPPAAPAPTV